MCLSLDLSPSFDMLFFLCMWVFAFVEILIDVWIKFNLPSVGSVHLDFTICPIQRTKIINLFNPRAPKPFSLSSRAFWEFRRVSNFLHKPFSFARTISTQIKRKHAHTNCNWKYKCYIYYRYIHMKGNAIERTTDSFLTKQHRIICEHTMLIT